MAKKANFPKIDFSHMPLFDTQLEIRQSAARFKVVAFGRQSGKSFLAKYEALDAAVNNGKRVWWVAPSIPTAADHWNDLVSLLEDVNFPYKSLNKSTKTIIFFGGGSIRIRSADIPDNLRGGTLDLLILDEAAFMIADVWEKILFATISASHGSVLFLSTPNGQNWFHRLFKMGQNPKYPMFKSWHMPSTSAPYQDKELLEVIRTSVPSMVWREEYLAEFIADSGGVFVGLENIPYLPMIAAPIAGHEYVAGVDWGLDEDDTVFTVIDKYERRQVFAIRFNSIGSIEQVERISDLVRLWRPRTIHIERNGVGGPLFQMIRDALEKVTQDMRSSGHLGFNEHLVNVKGVYMDNALKRRVIERLAADIEFNRFTPLTRVDDNDLDSFGAIQMSEMSTFQRKRTASGLEVAYKAAEGSHDDTVMALAMCYMGVDEFKVEAEPIVNVKIEVLRTSIKSPFRKQLKTIDRGRQRRRRGH